MKILLNNVSKRYFRQWIFKNVNYVFESGQSYAILGKNGSGKSTLLQCIIGATTSSSGTTEYFCGGNALNTVIVHEYTSFASPYLELIEEFTALEMLQFHFSFKKMIPNFTFEKMLNEVGLSAAANKQIQNFSSGMKQRLKLALAFFSDTQLLCLDEPTSNLDAEGINMYQHLINNYINQRTLIIASNDVVEYTVCENLLQLSNFQ